MRASVLGLLVLAACSGRQVSRLEIGGLDFDYGFVALLEADGRVAEVSAVFGVRDGALRLGTLPALELGDRDAQVLLLSLDAAELTRQDPSFDRTRAAELVLERGAPPSRGPELESLSVPSSHRSALPPATRVLVAQEDHLVEWTGERPALFGELRLHLPSDPEHCRPSLGDFADLGGSSNVFAGRLTPRESKVLDLVRVQEALHLGVIYQFAFLVADAGTEPRALLDVVAALSPPRESHPVVAMALDPQLYPGGERRAAVLVSTVYQVDPVASDVVELQIQGEQLAVVRAVATGTVCGTLIYRPEGRLLLGCKGGRLLSLEPGGRPQPAGRLPVLEGPGDGVDSLIATGDQARPVLAATRSRLHLYDAARDRWDYTELLQGGLSSAEAYRFGSLAAGQAADGSLELWAGAQRGSLFSKRGEADWVRVPLVYPPRFLPCAIADPADPVTLVSQKDLSGLSLGREWLHLLPFECNVVLHVRREDFCASLSVVQGGAVQTLEQPYAVLQAEAEGLVVSGTLGRMLRARWAQ